MTAFGAAPTAAPDARGSADEAEEQGRDFVAFAGAEPPLRPGEVLHAVERTRSGDEPALIPKASAGGRTTRSSGQR